MDATSGEKWCGCSCPQFRSLRPARQSLCAVGRLFLVRRKRFFLPPILLKLRFACRKIQRPKSRKRSVRDRRMDVMKRLALLPLSLLVFPLPDAGADSPPPPGGTAVRPADLVRRLGDDSSPVREQASRELLRLGPSARDALLQGAKDSDPEIRRR